MTSTSRPIEVLRKAVEWLEQRPAGLHPSLVMWYAEAAALVDEADEATSQ